MSWKDDYISLNYISRRVSRNINEHGDEIELETVMYHNHCHAVVTICQDEPPFKDCFAEARDLTERGAARKALKDLYLQAYTKH